LKSIYDIINEIPSKQFPESTFVYDEIDYIDPRINKFYTALKWLRKNKGLYWNDLHDENVLYRPSDDTLVAADVGLFRFGS
jgi:hypothetical protein